MSELEGGHIFCPKIHRNYICTTAVGRITAFREDVPVSKIRGSKVAFFPSTSYCKVACFPWHPPRWRPKGTCVHHKRVLPAPSLQLVLYAVNVYRYLQANPLLHVRLSLCWGGPHLLVAGDPGGKATSKIIIIISHAFCPSFRALVTASSAKTF